MDVMQVLMQIMITHRFSYEQMEDIVQNSAAGNWTRVFRVTGGNTHHYTTADAGDQQIDKLYSLKDFSLHALRFSITGNHWLTPCFYAMQHYMYI